MAENAPNNQPVNKQDAPNIASVLSAVEHEEERLRKAIEDQLRNKAQVDKTNRLTKEEVKLLPDTARLPFGDAAWRQLSTTQSYLLRLLLRNSRSAGGSSCTA
jgi:hypothetical protein